MNYFKDPPHRSEAWLRVDGTHYEVSDLGRVRSVPHIDHRGRPWPGKILRPFRDGVKGYVAVQLHGKRSKVHQLIARAFCDGYAVGLQVNHKDGNRSNNFASNLEWVTSSQNARHSYDVLGRVSSGGHRGKFGSKHHASKVVLATCCANGQSRLFGSGAEAARVLGIPSGSVPRCCNGQYASSHGWSFRYVA